MLKNMFLGGILAAMLGTSLSAAAISFGMDFKGYVTMLDPNGVALNNSSSDDPRFNGWRTPITGTMVLDVDSNGVRGTATFEPFFFIGLKASGRDISFVPAASVLNIPTNTLLVGNMLFDFGFTQGIPVSIVLDIGNLTTALMQSSPGTVIGAMLTPASDNTVFHSGGRYYTLPIGPCVVATTTWNTTDVDTDHDGTPGPITLGTNPSGTVPLLVDTVVDQTNGDIGIGGSPMKAGPFLGYNPNFDISEVTVTCVNAIGSCETGGVPVPALPLSPQPLAPVQSTAGSLLP